MKLAISKQELCSLLSAAAAVVSKTLSLPILGNVRLAAEVGGALEVAATDLERYVELSCGTAGVEQAGACTLPAKRLKAVAENMPSETLRLTWDAQLGALNVAGGTSSFTLLGLDADEFPAADDPRDPVSTLKVDARDTAYALSVALTSVSNDTSRYVLNGVLLELWDMLRFVSTDGRRLSVLERDFDEPLDNAVRLIVPTPAVVALVSALRDAEEGGEVLIELFPDCHQARFSVGRWRMTAKLIEGDFPNWRQVVPEGDRQGVIFDRVGMLKAVSRVALLGDKAVSFRFGEEGGQLVGESPDVGECVEEVDDLARPGGRDLTVKINPEFLKAPLRVLDLDELQLLVTDETSPVQLLAEADGYQYVLMPLRQG